MSFRALVLVTAAVVCVGCPGSIDDPNALVGELDCLVYAQQLMERSCASAGCHSAVDSDGNLDLETPGLVDRLVDVQAGGSSCGGGILINSEEPEASLMVTKMLPDPPCGDRMPLFERPAQQFEIDCMLEWVQSQVTQTEQ